MNGFEIGWKRECDDADAVLRHLGLDPQQCRTDGGWLNVARIKTLLAEHKAAEIERAVNRFMVWPLPKDFCPDCGISFDGRKDDEWNKNKTWPIGTNLLTVIQARSMFEHVFCAAKEQGS